jgi:hypothetical protein
VAADAAISGFDEDCSIARSAPDPDRPSSICESMAIAILSGRFAEHMIRLVKPPSATPGVAAPSPVSTPIMPTTALSGCWVPVPATKPERRR